jgi:WhiB family redox-sensing transcriptional regulator
VSQKEHQRRAKARWLDVLNAPWRTKAACSPTTGHAPPEVKRLPDMTSEGLYEQREAALFCHHYCGVREECLAYAKNTGEEHYVWGGTTAAERKHLMKKDRQARKESA